MTVNSKDISVVVQGAIHDKYTKICLNSIRKYLPESEIVLSTWKGSNLEGLSFDRLVLSDDPGCEIMDDKYGVPNNVNRQIVSSRYGILNTSRNYVLKLRSDIKLTGNSFLNYFDSDKYVHDQNSIFKRRILICNFYTSNPRKTNFLFHPSDWVSFGLKSDVLNLWDVELQIEPDSSRYFKKIEKAIDKDPCPSWLTRYIPEQYVWISCLAKNGVKLDFDHYYDFTERKLIQSEKLMVSNFMVLDYGTQYDIAFLKYDPSIHVPENQYNHYHWLLNYKKFIKQDYEIALLLVFMNDWKINRYLRRIKGLATFFIYSIKNFLKFFIVPVLILYNIILLFSRALKITLIKKNNNEV